MQLPVTKRIVIPQAAQTLNTIITIFQPFIRLYENASKSILNAMCRKQFE